MMTVDKELLFKPRLPEADVDVPGFGTFRVRGLSRAEVFEVQKMNGIGAIERKMLSLSLVEPRLTQAEVGQWQDAAPAGELEPLTDKIQELSGTKEGAAKEAYMEFEQDSDAEFRVLPGTATRAHGGSAAS